MKRNTDFSDIFDDDFEVTYEDIWDDVPASYRFRPRSDSHADYEAAYMRMMTHMKIRRTACMSKIHGHPGAGANGACLLLPRSARADASSPVPPPLLYVVLLLS